MESKTKKTLLIVGIVVAVVIVAAIIGGVAMSNASHILHLDAGKNYDNYSYTGGISPEEEYTYYYDRFTLSERVWKRSYGLTVNYAVSFPTGEHQISWWDDYDNWRSMMNDVEFYHYSKFPKSAEIGYMMFTEKYNGSIVGFKYVPETDMLSLMSPKVENRWKPVFWDW